MTRDELEAAYLAKGGKVTKCPPAMPRQRLSEPKTIAPPARSFPPLSVYRDAFTELAAKQLGPAKSADWWAAYDIGPCDPNRDLAEAAAAFVIARDEGLESGDLYRRSLCDAGRGERNR